MQIPGYENQVSSGRVQAARGEVSAPVNGAFGEKIAHAGENMARTVEHIAGASAQIAEQNQRAMERQQQRDKNLRKTAAILAWRKDNDELLNGKLNEDGSRVAGGLLTKQYGDADGITAEYNEKTRGEGGLMAKHLASAQSPEEREEWLLAFQQDFQNNFDTVARHQYKQQRAQGDLLTQAFQQQQAGLAGAIRSAEQMRRNLDTTYKAFSDNATVNGIPDKVQKVQRYTLAENNVKASIMGAVTDGDLVAAHNVLDGVKDDLLPADYNKLKAYVKKAEETYKNANQAERAAPLYTRALVLAENNPEQLQEEIVQLMRNPAQAMENYSQKMGPISAKQLVEYAKWAQTNLLDSDDTRAGQIKQQNWQEHESNFNSFNWKKKKDGSYLIGNKDMKNPQTVLAAIGALQGSIAHHDFNKSDMGKAQKNLAQLRYALGSMKIKGNDTALGEVVRQANLLTGATERRVETGEVTKIPIVVEGIETPFKSEIKNYETYYIGGILSPQERGLIIEQAAQFLQAANINLLGEDRQTRKAAVDAVQAVARDYVRNKFAVLLEDVQDVQVGNNTFKSYGIKPNKNLGANVSANLDGYRYEEQNGVAYLIKRDKNNNVLHRQLL